MNTQFVISTKEGNFKVVNLLLIQDFLIYLSDRFIRLYKTVLSVNNVKELIFLIQKIYEDKSAFSNAPGFRAKIWN